MVAAAGRGFRKHGYGGIGVDALAKEAEVTSGAFYSHFPSKEEAFKEAVTVGVQELHGAILAFREEHGPNWAKEFVESYLSEKRVCDLSESCPVQSLTPEVQRANAHVRAAFEAKMIDVVTAIADGLTGVPADKRLDRAWALLAVLSGGVTLARAVNDASIAEMIAEAIRNAALEHCL